MNPSQIRYWSHFSSLSLWSRGKPLTLSVWLPPSCCQEGIGGLSEARFPSKLHLFVAKLTSKSVSCSVNTKSFICASHHYADRRASCDDLQPFTLSDAKSHEKENVPGCCFCSGLKWGTQLFGWVHLVIAVTLRSLAHPGHSLPKYLKSHSDCTWKCPVRSYSCFHVSRAPHLPPLPTSAARHSSYSPVISGIAGHPLGSWANKLGGPLATSECSSGHQQLLGWSPLFSRSKSGGLVSTCLNVLTSKCISLHLLAISLDF